MFRCLKQFVNHNTNISYLKYIYIYYEKSISNGKVKVWGKSILYCWKYTAKLSEAQYSTTRISPGKMVVDLT